MSQGRLKMAEWFWRSCKYNKTDGHQWTKSDQKNLVESYNNIKLQFFIIDCYIYMYLTYWNKQPL